MRLFNRNWKEIAHYVRYNLKGFPLAFSMLASNSQRKHFGEWLRSHQKGYLLKRPMPWIAFDAYDYLAEMLPEKARVFEYGSGGSTLFWLTRKNCQCVSIEHNPQWFAIVNKYVAGLSNQKALEYRLVEPAVFKSDRLDVYDPTKYLDDKMRNFSFEKYVKQIDEFPDAYFDLVMVDGESRPACIAHGCRKVRSGGFLIVDNAERRDYFNHVKALLEPFDEISFRGVVPAAMIMSQTNIYRRR